MTEKEKEIRKHMDKLGLTREQAEQLWLEDNSNEVLPEVAEMERKAKECKRRYEKSDTVRKANTRERKVDHEKKEIIEIVAAVLSQRYHISSIKTETEIVFEDGDIHYTFKLTKHRKKDT